MKNKNDEVRQITELHLQQLQDELAAATERSRCAKRAMKDAKSEAKAAKRGKKQARKVLIAAQTAFEEQSTAAASQTAGHVGALTDATHQRIPDSPEVNPKRRRRSRSKEVVADSASGENTAIELTDQVPVATVK